MSNYSNIFSADYKKGYKANSMFQEMNDTNDFTIEEVLPMFNSSSYPQMIEELPTLKDRACDLPSFHKADIIISFLKNHSIKTEWVNDNPRVAKLISSGSCKTTILEDLFEKHKNKKSFQNDFEDYINKDIEGEEDEVNIYF